MIGNTFTNRSVNWLNLHYGVHRLGNDMIFVFVGVYLYQAGLAFWQILAAMGLVYVARIPLRFLSMRGCFRFGIRNVMMLGTLVYPTQYLVLGQVRGIDVWLGFFILLWAVTDVLYWLPYHTYMALLGDHEHRGKQIGTRESVAQLAGFLGPVAGGVLINTVHFLPTFFISAAIMALSAIPLLKTANVPLSEPWSFRQALRGIRKEGFWLYAAWGVHAQGYHLIWPIVLFVIIQNYAHLGGLLGLAVFFQMIGCLYAGHAFDRGHGKKLYPLGLLLMGVTIASKALGASTIPIIIGLDLIFMAGYCLFHPVMHSVFYNLAKKSSHPLWFQFMAELGWDVGSVVCCVLAATMLLMGASLATTMLLSVLGMAGLMAVLKKSLA